MTTDTQDLLQRAFADGHLQLITSGKTEKIHYVAVNVSEKWSRPRGLPRQGAHQVRGAVINMVVEFWRFGRVFERLLLKVDAGEQNRYNSQFRWFIKKVEEALEQVD